MKKNDLVKLITRKASIPDSAANEFFDIFLGKVAEEMEPGESARFGNLGYFHFRRGQIKKQEDENNSKKIEYLDLIIFSPSSELNIKSHDNVIFSVPEVHDNIRDSLDLHFSLSAGKPVLPLLERKELSEDVDQSSEADHRELERRARGLISNLHIEDNIRSDGEILLVDMKSIDSDQFELELSNEAVKKNSEKISGTSIHSSEKLKSKAWSFGNTLSKQIEDKSESESFLKDKPEKTKSESAKWDFGKRYLGNTQSSNSIAEVKSEPPKPEKQQDPKTEIKDFEESVETEEFFDIEDEETPDIKMDDFKISDEESKKETEEFERVRSISSTLDKKPGFKEDNKSGNEVDENYNTDHFENDNFFKELKNVVGKTDDESDVELSEEKEPTSPIEEPEVEIKLNRSQEKKIPKYGRRSSSSSFVKILAILIIIVGGLYILFKEDGNIDVKEEIPPAERNTSTTYVERDYEVPVTYPYDKNDNGQEISGIDLSKEKAPVSGEKVTTNNTAKNNVQIKEQPVANRTSNNANNGPALVESNIYNYGEYYVVQVSSFRSEQVAQNTVAKYNSQGYKASIENIVINGNNWYRVQVGNFKTLEEAQNFKNSNK